jgi:serine/threonine protein kinase
MLTGQAAFQGEDVTEILAAVVKGGANMEFLPANLHPRVRETITRCLQRDLKRRYQDIRDAQYEIEQALTDPGGVLTQTVSTTESRKKMPAMLSWVAAALVLGACIVGAAIWKSKPPEPRQVVRFEYELPEGQRPRFTDIRDSALAISPDGKRLFIAHTKDSTGAPSTS